MDYICAVVYLLPVSISICMCIKSGLERGVVIFNANIMHSEVPSHVKFVVYYALVM